MVRCFGPKKVGRSSSHREDMTSSIVSRPIPGVASSSSSPRRNPPRHRTTTTKATVGVTPPKLDVVTVQGSPTAAPHLEFLVQESHPRHQQHQRSRSLGPSSHPQGTRLPSSRSTPRREDPRNKGHGGEEDEALPGWANSPPRTHPPRDATSTTLQAPQHPHQTFGTYPFEDAEEEEDTIGNNVEYDYSSSNWWNASPTTPTRNSSTPLSSHRQGRRNPARLTSSSPRETPAIEPAGSQEFLDTPSAVRYATRGSLLVNLPSRRDPQPQRRQQPPPPPPHQPTQSFLQRRVVGKENNSDVDGGDKTDRLSDVASDVDSVTRERYMLACQMLKSAVTEKERLLQPLEKEFILSLLGDVDDNQTLHDDSVEISTLHRDADPLLRQHQHNALSPGLLWAKQQYDISCQTPNQQGLGFGTKHPHTATRASIKNLFSVPCTPTALSDSASEEEAVLQIPGCNVGVGSRLRGGEEGTPLVNHPSRRFNGWKYYKPTECPFRILGHFDPHLPRVLTPFIMENLRGFFPMGAVESNFWLKYSLVRDGASLPTLLDSIHNSIFTIIGVETKDGEVFGSFTATPWRSGTRWFGSNDAFVWRLKKSRYSQEERTVGNYENEMEVYPCTGSDHMIQYCTHKTIAVGGGEWVGDTCPFQEEPRGIGFMIDGDLVGGETNSCATFANPRLCRNTSTSNEFTIANVEVWTLTPCRNIEAAAKLEMAGVFWATTQASF